MYSNDPQYTIQKVAREVFNKYELGEDPMVLLIKHAKQEKLTPEMITNAVHYLNNEIYLDHYKKASKGNPKTLKVKDVIEALTPQAEKTAGIDTDYERTLTGYGYTKHDTSKLPYEDYQMTGTTRYHKSRGLLQKEAEFKRAATEKERQATQLGVEIAGAKHKLLDTIKLAYDRKEITPEELYLLYKTADDKDVSGVFESFLRNKKQYINDEKLQKFASQIVRLNPDSEIYKSMHVILEKKAAFKDLFDGYTSLELADRRRAGIKKLMEASYGILY